MLLSTLTVLSFLNLCCWAKQPKDACKVPEVDCLAIIGNAYRYNALTNTCEYKSYCSDGPFNHKTKKSCDRACVTKPTDNPCQPPTVECKAIKGRAFRYNAETNSCTEQNFCAKGSFNHKTRKACEKKCLKTPKDSCQPPTVECKAIKGRAFRYNAKTNMCSEQNFCAKGPFNHQTLAACQNTCVKKVDDPCKAPEIECQANLGTAYRYNAATNSCKKQRFCAQGSFNHKTRKACQKRCVKKKADPCKVPEVECKAIRGSAYRYNAATNTCKKQNYCAVGSFNFQTKKACKQSCVKSKLQSDSSMSSKSMSWGDFSLGEYRKQCDDAVFANEDVPSDCISGVEPACPVKENSPKVWRYDYESGRCLAELVCKAGFSNMFPSKKKCERRCVKKAGGDRKGGAEKCPRLGSECKAVRGHAWRYNPTSKSCQWVAICNLDWPYNFDTQGKCNKACGVKKGAIVSQTSSCSFSPNEPRCLVLPPNAPTVWRYDAVENRCKSTTVCMAGFGNMFHTEYACIGQCVKK